MDFLLSDELKEFRTSLGQFFSNSLSVKKRRSRYLLEKKNSWAWTKDEAAEWKELCELGIFLAILPEDLGGLGFGQLAAQLILEESGKELFVLPLWETVSFGLLPLFEVVTDENKRKKVAEQIAKGESRFTGAFEGSFKALYSLIVGSEVIEKPLPILATTGKVDGEFLLTGKVDFVPSVDAVNCLIVPAEIVRKSSPGAKKEIALFCVDLKKAGKDQIKIEPISTVDLLRPFYHVTLNNVPGENWVTFSSGKNIPLKRLLERVSLLAVAELIGGSESVLKLTLDHVKVRKQFGSAIGSFQAVSHKIVDMYGTQQQIWALSRFAAHCCDKGDNKQFFTSAPAVRGFTSETMTKIVEAAIQVHGGIGFTYEYDLHLYLRRALMFSELLHGNSEERYLQLAEELLRA